MRTATINIHTFDELSDTAKEKARDWWRECDDGDSDLADESVHDFIQHKYPFLTDTKAQWQVAYCQSDDFTFTDGEIDLASFMRRECIEVTFKEVYESAKIGLAEARFHFTHTGGGGGYCNICIDLDEDKPNPESMGASSVQELETTLTNAIRDIEKEAYRYLRTEYDYRNGNKQVDDIIRSNEYEFTADGSIYV